MALDNTTFDTEARRRVAAYFDAKRYGSHDARVQDELAVLRALGLEPEVSVATTLTDAALVDQTTAYDEPLDPDLDDDLTV